jgi:peptidoglycan hydrolase CwlO-like protein
MAGLDDLSKKLKKKVGKAEKGLKKSVGSAGKGIKKGLKDAEKGIKDVGDKASDAVKTFEINKDIEKKEEEIEALNFKIGEKAVSLAKNGAKLDPDLMKIVNKVLDAQAKIKEMKAKIKTLKKD